MSEKERQDIQAAAEIYKDLPPYLKGKIDGYAEALKEKRAQSQQEPDASDTTGAA